MKAIKIVGGSLLLTIAVTVFSAHPYRAQPGWGDIGRDWGPWRLQLHVENLLDADWNEAQFDTESRLRDEAAPVAELHFTPGNPRGAQLGLSYRF